MKSVTQMQLEEIERLKQLNLQLTQQTLQLMSTVHNLSMILSHCTDVEFVNFLKNSEQYMQMHNQLLTQYLEDDD